MKEKYEFEKKFRVLVEPGADPVEGGGHMFAHGGPVRAGAVKINIFWGRKKPLALGREDLP